MTTRFTAIDQINNGVSGIKSGYDTGLKSDIVIPSCGIEDVDVALFNLFDKEIQPMVSIQDFSELKRVPVIFAAGEKWALLKRGKPIRDKSNTLILPLVTIMRTSISQGLDDITQRGINQQTGELVIRRRLDSSDRAYQNLLNKQFITSQKNVAVNINDPTIDNQNITGRKTGKSKATLDTRRGALLTSNLSNNIYETILVPAPQFYTSTYQVTVWTQYTQHMNQIIEKMISSFLPQAQSWKVITNKGYWFVASIDGGAFNIETNFDDMSSAERYVRCSFEIKIPAYLWVSSAPGVPIPVKKYISSPIIEFAIASKGTPDPSFIVSEEFSNNFYVGNDDPTLPLANEPNARPDQRRTGSTITPNRGIIQTSNPESPVAATANRDIDSEINMLDKVSPIVYTKVSLPVYPGASQPIVGVDIGSEIKYIKVVSKNPTTGETVYAETNMNAGVEVLPVDKLE